jgi:raffinose/stachyose/melibiose transport system substrate-binding protein
MQAENLVDLSSHSFLNNYYSGILNSVDVDGSVYLLPTGYNVYGITYNKTIMEENGWEVPDSLEELEELIPKIKEAGYIPFGNMMELDSYPFNYFFAVGSTGYFSTQEGLKWKKNFISGDAKAVGTDGFITSAEYFRRYIDDGIITNEHMTVDEYTKSGDTVFLLSLTSVDPIVTTDDGKTYEFGIMPWLSEDGSYNMMIQNVNKFYGINKHLEEDGNEEKLIDAMHVLKFISTEKGMESLMGTDSTYMSPLISNSLSENHPYYEVLEDIYSGHMVSLTYVGWEDLIVPIAKDIRSYIGSDETADKLAEGFDSTYNSVGNSTEDYYGTAEEIISFDDTMKLVAIAETKAVDADCAIVSVNGSHGKNLNNYKGVGGKLYSGEINTVKINVFRPNGSTISVLELTGAEIMKMQEEGFDLYDTGEPFEYRLFTKNDMKLDDNKTYKLAVSTDELSDEYAEKSEVIDVSPLDAIRNYTSEIGVLNAENIVW